MTDTIIYYSFAVNTDCKSRESNEVSTNSGYISSHVVDTKGCGSSGSPWIISANPGQTIQLDLIDFAANSQTSNLVSCRSVYGFILERALGINHTICGGRHREGALYTSKTNSVEIHLAHRNGRGDNNFLLRYQSKYRLENKYGILVVIVKINVIWLKNIKFMTKSCI